MTERRKPTDAEIEATIRRVAADFGVRVYVQKVVIRDGIHSLGVERSGFFGSVRAILRSDGEINTIDICMSST